MGQASGPPGASRDTRGFPDGSPKTKKRSPSDLRREARRLAQRLSEARSERRKSWPSGQSEFATDRQEAKLAELHGDKRALRRDVYARNPKLEGADFRRSHPGRTR